MIKKIKISNFKSVQDNTINLGRFNVFIGENGCGKSNLLEAICYASASGSKEIPNSVLVSKGVRVVPGKMTHSAFESDSKNNFSIEVQDNLDRIVHYEFTNDEKPFSSWKANTESVEFKDDFYPKDFLTAFKNYLFNSKEFVKKAYQNSYGATITINEDRLKTLKDIFQTVIKSKQKSSEKEKMDLTRKIMLVVHSDSVGFGFKELDDFAIYSPENSYLRIFEDEESNKALGIKGQGIFRLVQSLATSKDKVRYNEIRNLMKLIDWLDDIQVPDDLFATETRLNIKDRFISEDIAYFDQRSSNEGFLFLLFYFSLFISDDTPSFFAIDNIDASLNPKLCSKLIVELAKLSKKYNKQVILTTHNPAILDGISLSDDEQRLFVVFRNGAGHTKTRRIQRPVPVENQPQPLLSDLFMSGAIGGLPRNF